MSIQPKSIENVINVVIKQENNDSKQHCEIKHDNFTLAGSNKNGMYCTNNFNQLKSETQDSIPIKHETEDLYANPTSNSTLLNVDDIKIEKSDLSDGAESKTRETKILSGNMFGSHLHNYDLYDAQSIDMLHDLNCIMDFDEVKIFSDGFPLTLMNSGESENEAESNVVVEEDPLFIDNNMEKNTNLEGTEHRQRTQIRSGLKRKATEEPKRTKKPKHLKKCVVSNNDHINYILGELDIDIKLEEPEDNEITKDELERLYNLKVKIAHEIPPQHEIGRSAGSQPLTKAEKKQFFKYGPLKHGVFTPAEDKVIRDNWATFCQTHNWDPTHIEPFISTMSANKFHIKSAEERKRFTQFLANGLPWRSLYSVYYRFRHLYGNHERNFKRYTFSEDKQIMSYVRQNEGKKFRRIFPQLGKKLHRTSHSVWIRYQFLKRKKQASGETLAYNDKWTLSSIRKFIQVLLDVTLSESIEDLKDAIIPKEVWLKLEKKLNIYYNVLKTFWSNQLHMQLFSPGPIYLNDIKIKLIEYVYEKGFSSTREIVWHNLAKHFDGIPTVFLCRVFLYLVHACAKKTKTKNFPEIIEYLYVNKIKDIKAAETDKFLPRLSYNKGVLKIVEEDINDD